MALIFGAKQSKNHDEKSKGKSIRDKILIAPGFNPENLRLNNSFFLAWIFGAKQSKNHDKKRWEKSPIENEKNEKEYKKSRQPTIWTLTNIQSSRKS